MDASKRDELISTIYDAAVGNRRWNEALVLLADLTGCAATALEFYDRRSGQMAACNPFVAPEYGKSYVSYWHHCFPLWRKYPLFPVGRLLRRTDIMTHEAALKTPFLNEWLRPQGFGGDNRFVNLIRNDRAYVRLFAGKPLRVTEFSPAEEHLLTGLISHFIRAVSIRRRLQIAEARQANMVGEAAPEGFLIVDDRGRILVVDETTHQRLWAAGLLSSLGDRSGAEDDNPALARLILAATGKGRQGPRAGQLEHRGRDGALLSLTVIPVSECATAENPWLIVDQPAALVWVSAPEDNARERVARLAANHCLTPAEAAVAIEAAKGDGRAAVAARLGIRESTVRSHLSAIFDKLGIHRQAELTRIVANA